MKTKLQALIERWKIQAENAVGARAISCGNIQKHIKELTAVLEGDDAEQQRIDELEAALEEAKLFANVVECWGRTDCEIYKHELKASADLAIERINKALEG